jgi:adenosylcobyric acid synthase
MTKVIQILGTGSGVGKSIITAGLCRIFVQNGFKTAPFKAQNMALNSFITKNGGEIGRAQAVQAQACKIEPTVDMNPILLKPTSDVGAQIILQGKAIGNMTAVEYTKYKKEAVKVVYESFNRLKQEYDVIVIEGAGSPAEINLKQHDIVNMKMAEMADAPVILVGDIDKGGVFAWLCGTLDLLEPHEQDRVKGMIINKFRGDKTLLMPGVDFLEQKTGKKVLGVVSYFKDIMIPEEDGLFEDNEVDSKNTSIKIEIIYLPHISNFTDFDVLRQDSDVSVKFLRNGEKISKDCDVIIIPGSKNTIFDFQFLKNKGYVEQLEQLKTEGKEIIGICGGFQMLGKKILDPFQIESDAEEIKGLGFLNIISTLEKEKVTSQVTAKDLSFNTQVNAYEIHHGKTEVLDELEPMFRIGDKDDGVRQDNVWGTYLHGVFDNHEFRNEFLNKIRKNKGLRYLESKRFDQDKEFDKLAQALKEELDMDYLYSILNM